MGTRTVSPTAPAGPEQSERGHPAPMWGSVTLAVVAGGLLLWWGGGAVTEALPGLPYPGPVTPWALPAAKLGTQLGAVATVGLLLAAVALSPRDLGRLSRSGYRRMLAAGWAALFWSACTAATIAFTISDLLARPVSENTPTSVLTFVLTVDVGRAYALSMVLSVLVLIVCRVSLRPVGATFALAAALLAVVPPIFTGHAASAGDHQLAVSSLLLHVVPVTVWAGGLLALLVSGSRTADLAVDGTPVLPAGRRVPAGGGGVRGAGGDDPAAVPGGCGRHRVRADGPDQGRGPGGAGGHRPGPPPVRDPGPAAR